MPFHQVRVVILGQDPYPTPGDAMGLSFSVAPGRRPAGSLGNIYKELETDCGLLPSSSGDLTPVSGLAGCDSSSCAPLVWDGSSKLAGLNAAFVIWCVTQHTTQQLCGTEQWRVRSCVC